jgi:divalent metal cation (Fe/Co/Zn/Cd) transporter
LTEFFVSVLRFFTGNSRSLHSILVSLVLVVVGVVVAWILTLVGLGLIVWSLYLYLTGFFNPPVAALLTGIVTLVVTMCILFCLRFFKINRGKRRKREITTLFSWLKRYPLEATLLSLTTGLLIGISPDIRRALADGIVWFLRHNLFEEEDRRHSKEKTD